MVTKPVPGASEDVWGQILNDALDDLQGQADAKAPAVAELPAQIYEPVCAWGDQGAIQIEAFTGMLVVDLPGVPADNFFSITIEGCTGATQGPWRLNAGFFAAPSAPPNRFRNLGATLDNPNPPPLASVRLALSTTTGHILLILGTPTTAWAATMLTVSRAVVGWKGDTAAFTAPWRLLTTASEADFGDIAAVPVRRLTFHNSDTTRPTSGFIGDRWTNPATGQTWEWTKPLGGAAMWAPLPGTLIYQVRDDARSTAQTVTSNTPMKWWGGVDHDLHGLFVQDTSGLILPTPGWYQLAGWIVYGQMNQSGGQNNTGTYRRAYWMRNTQGLPGGMNIGPPTTGHMMMLTQMVKITAANSTVSLVPNFDATGAVTLASGQYASQMAVTYLGS